MARRFPQHIEKLGLAKVPLDFVWKGRLAHIGPIEGTEMHAAFGRLTYLAAQAVAVSACEWGLARLSAHADLQMDQEVLEAVRAWQVSKLYLKVNPIALSKLLKRKGDPAIEAASDLTELLAPTIKARWIEYPFPVPSDFAHVAFLARHVMPKKERKPFEEWLAWAFDRANSVAARPATPMPSYEDCNEDDATYFAAGRPYFGEPLPQQALQPDMGYEPVQRAELVDAFLRSIDWATNRFLNSPDEMKQAGFNGTPYRYTAE